MARCGPPAAAVPLLEGHREVFNVPAELPPVFSPSAFVQATSPKGEDGASVGAQKTLMYGRGTSAMLRTFSTETRPRGAPYLGRGQSVVLGDAEQVVTPKAMTGLWARFGVRSPEELRKVLAFALAAFLANSFFVIGRNIGTVLFLAHLGSEHLTMAIFASGVASVVVGQVFSACSRGRSPAQVNSWLLGISSLTMGILYFATLASPKGMPEAFVERAVVYVIFLAVYMAEDIFAMFVAMQQASVAQSAFSITDSKRLFGLVQLGNSFAAMTVGICIGSISAVVGTVALLAIQAAILVASLALNVYVGRRYTADAVPGKKKPKKKVAGGGGNTGNEPWWKNFLVLSMGLWSFTVIFTKTMFEYQYNVLVAGELSSQQMVALTGYLYAGAGLASTVINIAGTKVFEKLGMQGAILATPAALLSVSIAILVHPTVASTFAGRLADLTLRWSLNNSVRTVLWIAVPLQQAQAAKPVVEGTLKKMGQAFNAMVITATLLISGGSMNALSFLSLAFCTLLFACCMRVYSLYLQSMWNRIKRRELEHFDELPFDPNIDKKVMDKLMNGGPVAQLTVLSQLGKGLCPSFWEDFCSRFYTLQAAVQVKILELSREQRFRVSDDFLLEMLGRADLEPAVLQVAVFAVADRKLFAALDSLLGFLADTRPSLRAAAAVAIIKIGWGVGLGPTSSSALLVLETMLGAPLAGFANPGSRGSAGGIEALARAVLVSRGFHIDPGDDLDVEELDEQAAALTHEWGEAIESCNATLAVLLAIQLTHLRSAAAELRREQQHRGSLVDGSDAQDQHLDEHLLPELPMVARPSRRKSLQGAEVVRVSSFVECEETVVALQTMQQLPDPRELLTYESLLRFLSTDAHPKVRVAALALITERDADLPRLRHQTVLDVLVDNLQSATTYTAAEAALWRLNVPARVQEAVLEALKFNFDRHKEIASHRGIDAPDWSAQYVGVSVNMMYLLKFLRRQCVHVSDADLQALRASCTCDKLLDFSNATVDADVLQEMYITMVDLKDRGFVVSRELAESRIYHVAEKMCQGLAVQQWMQRRSKSLSSHQLRALRRFFEPPPAAANGNWLFPVARPQGKGVRNISDKDLVATFLGIGLGYISEHIYLQRLQLLQLAVLVSRNLPTSYKSSSVFAAWRVLRSKDAASEAAVIEVLDSMLPVHLKGVVIPLLDSSPIEKKLSVGEALGDVSRITWKDETTPPPWAGEWFQGSFSLLGSQFSAMLSRVACLRDDEELPPAPTEASLLPKIFLLYKVRLYAGLLSIHLAELAMVLSIRRCSGGPFDCRKGETYFIAEGSFHVPQTGQALHEGDVIQELHAICKELPVMEVECKSPEGGCVMCLSHQGLFELMVRLSPKFALGILKNLARLLPAAQTGGVRSTRPLATAFALRGRIGTENAEGLAKGQSQEWRDAPTERCIEVALEPDAKRAQDRDDAQEPGDQGVIRRTNANDLAELARQHCPAEEAHVVQSADFKSPSMGHHRSLDDHPAGEEGLLARPAEGPSQRNSISFLEKLMLLQEVKMFRYVPLEYLPDVAKCSAAVFKERHAILTTQGQPTDATLYIVAEGSVGLYQQVTEEGSGPALGAVEGGDPKAAAAKAKGKDLGVMLRRLQAGDTMGNTALLNDTHWRYTTMALEDTWLLCIDRADLTDVLRGQQDLARAVIHGLYKTFTRRIKNTVIRELTPS